MTPPVIRDFNPDTDKPAVIALIAELQDNEKSFDNRIPPGGNMAEKYYTWILQRNSEYSGKILVAESGGQIIGFIDVLGRMKYTDPDDYPHDYAYIDEIIVRDAFRNKGTGKALMAAAEAYARGLGVKSLQLEVTAANLKARRFYTSSGFKTMWLEMEKKLE